jgi:hypothetical protein
MKKSLLFFVIDILNLSENDLGLKTDVVLFFKFFPGSVF